MPRSTPHCAITSLLAALSLSSAAACGNAGCPSGTTKEGNVCKLADDTESVQGDPGTNTSAVQTAASDGAQSSASGRAAPISGSSGSSVPPARGSQTDVASGAGGQSTAGTPGSGSQAGAAGSAHAGTDGATGAAGKTAPSGGGSAPMTGSGPCQGKVGENVCDGATLYQCAADGSSTPETCDSAMHCQLGLTNGKCAICDPGSKVCAPDGTLQECSTDGSQMTAGQSCGANMCDAKNGRCYVCSPNNVRCDAQAVATCTADGQMETKTTCGGSTPYCQNNKCVACTDSSQCTSTSDCGSMTCDTTSNRCVTGPNKPANTPCAGGGICTALGACTMCGNGKADPGETCETAGPYAYAAGTCDPATCQLTDYAYGACGDGQTLCPQNQSIWFCGPQGACSAVCTNSSQCQTTQGKGACVTVGSGSDCAVPCTTIGSTAGCPPGLRCVNLAGLGLQPLCGSVDRPATQ
jgi:hypothetical protein